MIKACLFDLYGILVSSTKCDGMGTEELPVRDRSLDILSKTGRPTGLTPEENRERVYENTKTFFEYNSAQMPDMILPGALDFVKDLYRHGIKLASTATDCRPKSVLSSVGLYSMFDYIVEPGTVAERPSPEALLRAANQLGIEPEECIAFESTPEGIEAAKAVGMRSVAIGDLAKLYKANMGAPTIKGFTLQSLKDGIEVPKYQC